jgi:hypothetical protein
MTRADAERLCERLALEHPDRGSHGWLPQQQPDGEWVVVKFPLPEGSPAGEPRTTIEAKPRPPQSDDAPAWRSGNVPPYVAGG